MIKKIKKPLFINLLILVLFFSSGRLLAQSCDSNIQKALEQTRITTFEKITQGTVGEFVVRYPLAGTTYTLTDQSGAVYSKTYTGTPVEITLRIPIGVVNTTRRFSLKVQNGACSYETGFDYTITPQTTLALSIRVEQEWCLRGGGIFFKLIGTGANEANYNFFIKKSTDANYDRSKHISPASGLQAIAAGKYDILAEHKTDPTQKIEVQNIEVKLALEDTEYTVLYVPSVCPGHNGNIQVNVTKGKYPLYFTLLKADDTAYSTATTRQTSNIFTNIPVGNYKVRVEDYCAIGGGNAQQPKPVTVKNYNFTINRMENLAAWEYGCHYVSFDRLFFEIDNLKEILDADAFPYPFTINVTFQSPTNRTYAKTYVINNRRELETIFAISQRNGVETFLYTRNYIRENYPVEYGVWKINSQLISCGTTKNIPEKQATVDDPFDAINVTLNNITVGNSCNSVAIVRNTVYSTASTRDTNIPVYFVLENYPSGFIPEAAGFYKITSANPSLNNKYAKRLDGNDSNLVDPQFLTAGQQFTFKMVYENCDRVKTKTVIIPASSAIPSGIYPHPAGTCKGVSASGTDYATLVIEQRTGSPITQMVLKATTADTSKLPAGMTLPYIIKDSERITDKYWMVRDLPKGKYTIEHTNTCGVTASQEYELAGETYNISWVEGCTPKLNFIYTTTQMKDYTSFLIEHYNDENGQWERVELFTPSNNAPYQYEITGNTRGKFRLAYFVSATSGFMRQGVSYDCKQVISEKEFRGTMLEPKVYGFGCNNNKYQVAVRPRGGIPPYTYKLVSKVVAGVTTPLNIASDDENFFLNIDGSDSEARYVFQVEDSCREARTVDYKVSNFIPPKLETEQEFYCTGQRAKLSIPQLGTKVKIEWYRSDNPSHVLGRNNEYVIDSLTEDDFTYTYGVRLTGQFSNDVNVCIAGANLQSYKFKRKVVSIPKFTMPANTPVRKCVDGSIANETFDLNSLFNKSADLTTYLAANPSVITKIRDKAGVVSVPNDGIVNINSIDFLSRTITFVYSVLNACGDRILEVENTLTVAPVVSYYTNTTVNICKVAPTYKDIKEYILANNSSVRSANVGFDWYENLADANAENNKKSETSSLGTLTEGTPKTVYLRYTKSGFCNGKVLAIQVNKVSTAALPAKSLGTICALNVLQLKKLIDPNDFAKIFIYQNNTVLPDNYQLTSDSNITYTKQVSDNCQTAKANVTFTAKAVTQVEAKTLSLCTSLDNRGNAYVTHEQVKAKIRESYPNAEANGIKLYIKDDYSERYSEYTPNEFFVYQPLYYTVTETGKCESAPKQLNFSASTDVTPAAPISVSLCENTTVADLLAKITGNNKKVYKDGVLQTSTDPIDWDMADKYQYTLENAGKCPSLQVIITLTKSTNVTPAPTKVVSFCSATPRVIDLRTAIGDSTAKIYLKNGNRYDQQPDTAFINTALTYYYTIEQAGKCISPKGLIAYSIGTASPAGYFNNSVTCPTTVGQLKAEIRAAEATRVSDELKIYEGTVDPPTSASLTDNTPITATQYSYTYTPTGGCPSPIRIVDIIKPNAPTVAQTTQIVCGATATVANLQPQGPNIRWYQSATGGTPLATNTILTVGDYYVAQTNAGGTCESTRVKVTVQQGTGGNETLNFQSTNNTLNCIPTGQLRFQIQNAQTGKSYRVQLTEYPTGYTGATEFTIIEGDKDGATPFVKFTGYNMPAGTYKARLITCNVANGQPVPATIAQMQRDFPAPDRRNQDFGKDQVYRDIQSLGQTSCDYLDIRYDNNTNSPFHKYFNTPELVQLYEYTAYSDYDLQHIYGGDRNNPSIVWRDLFSVPTGKTSAPKMVYYDLRAHNRTYKDLKEDPNKLPKFYFRIKGHNNCNNQTTPMLAGDMRFMNTGIVFGGTCAAPKMSITAENQIVCYPVNYIIKQNGVKVGEGQITTSGERKEVTTLSNGQPFSANQEYEVVFTSTDGQTATRKETFNTFYNLVRPGGQYKQEIRCFGDTRTPKGRIEVLFRVNQSGSILPMNGFKVTLLQAPADYVNESGKLKLNETVTINYRNPNSLTTNIMATQNQDDLTQNFSLPEGTYKLKVEDSCGNVTYLYSGTDSTRQQFDLVYPSYQEKPLTPETRTECTKVKVYPFKGNAAFDWLQAEGRNRSVYVYLYRRPTGINPGDVTVSSNLSQQVGATNYIKAVYNPNDPTSADQYFSLPRNQNSEGSYTFIYGGKIDANNSNEQDIITYIASSGTNGCARIFDISVDDVLLNFDRNGYIGYKCENNTGKIVVKAINGIGGSGTYKYELYDVKNGTLIATQTAAKGVEVTFTNLGTFAPGQNSRWVRITDSACASEPVWRQLPIADASQANLLLKNPLNTAYCEGAALTIELRSIGATKYVWTLPNGTTQETTLPKLEINSLQAAHSGTYSVKAEGLACGANVLTFNYNITVLSRPTAGQTYTFCQGANVAALKARVDTNTTIVKVYKNGVLVSDDNQQLTTTDTYTVSKSNASCETDKVGVTIALTNPSAPTVAPARTECPTSVSTLFDMATLVTPASGYTLKWYDAATGGTALAASPKVDRHVTAKTVTTKYVSQEKDGCQSARVAVTYTVDDTQVPTLTINDIVLDCSATNFDTLVTNWLATAVATDTCGTPVITNNYVKPADLCGTGEITVIFTAKDGFNNQTQKTAKIRFVVAKDDDYTATPVKTSSSEQVVKNNGGTPYNILTNDKLYGNGATISNVTIAEVTPNTYVKIDTATGQVKVKANTPVGTYTVTYRICDRNTPAACSNTATVKVKVTSTIVANNDPDTTVAKGGTVDILTNDRLNGNPVTTTNVDVTIPNNGGLTGLTVDSTTGKLKVPSTATPGTYTVTYKICDKAHSNVCDTATVKITVTPTIVANNDPDTSVGKGGEVDILTNDRLNGNPVVPTAVDITIPNNGGLTGLTVDPSTGKLKVPNNATPGTYTVTYKICDKSHSNVCDTATVKITVTGSTTPAIVANDDPDTTVGKGGEVDILTNDRLNGNPVVPTAVDITIPNNGGLTGLTVDPSTGKLKVPNNATPGTYTVTYKICDKSHSNVCDTATVKIIITSARRTIKAIDDNFGKISNVADYTTIETVFSSGIDTMEGVIGTLSPESDVILTPGTAPHRGITMNPNGSITVKAGTPVGTYTYTYTICEKAVPTNCDSAKVTLEVVNSTILAKDDEYEVGTLGGLTPSILNNDILKGKVGLTADDVEIEDTANQARADKHLVIGTDGRITVKPGIEARTEPYIYYYTIKEKANIVNLSNAVVKIKVVSFTAVDDEDKIINDKSKEQKIPSVLSNDEIGGERPKPEINVIFTPTKVKDKDGNEVPGIVINPQDGKITVAPNTPDGVYTYSYTICKKTIPNECKEAKGVIKLLPELEAVDDDFTSTPVNVTKGAANAGNILENDLYAGKKVLDHLDKLTATISDNGGLSGAKIDEQGNLIIPQGTPVKVYELTYNLCIKDNPEVCKAAKIKVEVIKDKPLTIYNGVSADGDGHNDYFKIDGIEYYPKNNLKIFNRWGVLVYEKDGYTNNQPFDGHSNGRVTISADSKLPQGTYYYVLEYEDSNDQSHTEKGWLYLKY